MHKIIACIDGQDYTEDVCHAALWAANQLNLPLLLVHSIEKSISLGAKNYSGAIGLGARSALLEELSEVDAQQSKLALKLGRELLDNVQQYAIEQGTNTVEQMLRHGALLDTIGDLEADARLLVVGRSSDSFRAIGSNIEQIIRQVATPVLIPQQNFSTPQSFMLAYDGRETADKAVQRVAESGLLKTMNCHLVSVENSKKDLRANFERVKQQLLDSGLKVEAHFLTGNISANLISYQQSNNIDLVVMGAFSHSKLVSIFVGSNTLRMLENTNTSLLVLR